MSYTTWKFLDPNPLDYRIFLRRLIILQQDRRHSRKLAKSLQHDIAIAKTAKVKPEFFPRATRAMENRSVCTCPTCNSPGIYYHKSPEMLTGNPVWFEDGNWQCFNCFSGLTNPGRRS